MRHAREGCFRNPADAAFTELDGYQPPNRDHSATSAPSLTTW